ncbi:MAG: hypothetical protein Q9181_004336 [Wetmoreana brouardii]
MDLIEELERMANNAMDSCEREYEPSEEDITRWVSDELCETVRSRKEAQGFDREAYEYMVGSDGPLAASRVTTKVYGSSASQVDTSWLLKLEGVLGTPEQIQKIANLHQLPQVFPGISTTGDALFCSINGETKESIEHWLLEKRHPVKPIFVRDCIARKALAADSVQPALGPEIQYRECAAAPIVDTTLPQHRGSSRRSFHPVIQDEYPVWYFFYGTLQDPDLLIRQQLLPEKEHPVMITAHVLGGLIKMWGENYKALVDGAETDIVHGSAYEVTSEEQEEALRRYETEHYEVVRCIITMPNQTIQGLTFRFAKPELLRG